MNIIENLNGAVGVCVGNASNITTVDVTSNLSIFYCMHTKENGVKYTVSNLKMDIMHNRKKGGVIM